MGSCHNGLQAILKENIGKHNIYVHCYAHLLNLVHSNASSQNINVLSLFSNLESLHNILKNGSYKTHLLFEKAHR